MSSNEPWPFGTVLRSAGAEEVLRGMVVADDGRVIWMTSLGGDAPSHNHFYAYGRVWSWTQSREFWTEVTDDPEP